MHRKTLLATAFTVALVGLGGIAQAQTRTTTTTTVITVAPPAPRTEVVPAPRAGWLWAPGHYEYNGGQYAWNEGRWMHERSGYEYREPRWVQRGDGSWYLVGNSWERRFDDRQARGRDSDGDGVPDRLDRFPRDPNRS
ncbi:hypothetical protein [Ramlibacter sp.]|uniref:hypothetical protein n=1 Tax=Ramlibacter sp. TaxID=1917967 RepID=UPI002637ECA1|nr:hypothetical protein [Ramlibacter sp.]MDB5956024.1 hypothetical protein [Ramlibacter sp.]